MGCRRLTGPEKPVSVSVLRIVLVIFALWVLVVEPTFGAYERIEQRAPQSDRVGGDAPSSDLDQQVPADLVVAPSWVNQHGRDVLAGSLLDPVSLASPLDSLAPTIPSLGLPAEPSLPCPSSAQIGRASCREGV